MIGGFEGLVVVWAVGCAGFVLGAWWSSLHRQEP